MNSFLTLPDCGDDLTLTAIDVNQDCTLYDQVFSQICGVILMPNTASAVPDWTDVDSWATVIDNSLANNSKGKYLVGEGEIEEPDGDTAEYPKRQLRILNRVYTLDLTIKNLSDAQYEFLRAMQNGWTGFKFWIETVGGRLLGGSSGIAPVLVNVSFLYSGGRNDREEAVLTLQYESDGDPPRTDITGLADAVANVVTVYTAFGPSSGGDEAFGPTPGGDEVWGFAE